MNIRQIILEIAHHYIAEKTSNFKNNPLADKIRNKYPEYFREFLKEYGDRYAVKGSPGQGNWADCPWFAIFDTIKTQSAQYGYYIVYLFDSKMKGVYLSLNQGVTDIRNEYKRDAKIVLSSRSEDYRSKLDFLAHDNISIYLNSTLPNPILYEKGNILATYYDIQNLPNEETLEDDLKRFIKYYQELVLIDFSLTNYDVEYSIEEIKKRRLHEKFDRRGDLASIVKRRKGYTCEVCGFSFTDKYGELGTQYIEAHHLIPFSSLKEGNTRLNLEKDFAVLCSNCHRMIHRLKDSSDIEYLKAIVKKYNQKQ